MKNTHRTWIPLGRNLSIIQETYTVSGAAAEHKPVERRMKGSCCLMRWGRHLNYSGMSSYTPSQKTLMDVHADNEITTGYKMCLVPARTFQSFSLEPVIQKYCCCFFFTIKGSVTSTTNTPRSIYEGKIKEGKTNETCVFEIKNVNNI